MGVSEEWREEIWGSGQFWKSLWNEMRCLAVQDVIQDSDGEMETELRRRAQARSQRESE